MIGMVRLQHHMTGTIRASGPARHLHDELRHAFGGPEVGTEQTVIDIDDRSKTDIGKVMAFGQHLRADQQPRLTAVHTIQQHLQ